MSRDLLTLTGVGKDFSKIESSGGRLALVSKFLQNKSSAKVFTAVNDVNLTVKAGQSVGLIGANGAGKSTLLKIIAGVAKPTRGSVVVNGRIGALLEGRPVLSGPRCGCDRRDRRGARRRAALTWSTRSRGRARRLRVAAG